MSSIENVDQIMILSILDRLMEENKTNKETFISLYSQKQAVLNLIKAENINAVRYKILQKKVYKGEDEKYKEIARLDLEKIKDMKDEALLFEWFKEMIEETGKHVDEQQKIFNSFSSEKKPTTALVSDVKSRIRESQLKKTQKVQINQININEKQVVSLRAADDLLRVYQNSAKIYQKVYDRKMRLLKMIESKQLTAEQYKSTLEHYLTKIKNQLVATDTRQELQNLTIFYKGQIQPWFNDIVAEGKELVSKQGKHLYKLNPGLGASIFKSSISASKMMPASEPAKKVQLNVEQQPKSQIKNASKNEEAILPSKPQKKEQIQLKNEGEEKMPSKIRGSELKSIIPLKKSQIKPLEEKNVSKIKDISDNSDVKKNQSQVKSKIDLKIEEPHESKMKKEHQSNAHSKIDIQLGNSSDSPDIDQIDSFQVLQELFNQNINNEEICQKILARKEKLLEDSMNGALTAQEYKRRLEDYLRHCNNQQINNTLQFELSMIKDIHNNNIEAWFQDIVEVTRPSNIEGLIGNVNEINLRDSKAQSQQQMEAHRESLKRESKKIYYDRRSKVIGRQEQFLREISKFQSLIYYFRRNKIPYNSNKYLVYYQKTTKKQILHQLKRIEDDDNLDVNMLSSQLCPPLTQQIFYGGALQTLKKEKIAKMIQLFNTELSSLKDYISKIKKVENRKNIQKTNEEIEECIKNINYLREWSVSGFQPLPGISKEIVKKYSMDFNKLKPNQIEIQIIDISGTNQNLTLKIFVDGYSLEPKLTFDFQMKKFTPKSGIIEVNDEKLWTEIMKGRGRHFRFVLEKKGFFGGGEKIGEESIEPIFVRNNVKECTADIKNEIQIRCMMKVEMARSPIIRQVPHFLLKKYPKYEHSNFVEEELIKQFLMYTNPTASEIK